MKAKNSADVKSKIASFSVSIRDFLTLNEDFMMSTSSDCSKGYYYKKNNLATVLLYLVMEVKLVCLSVGWSVGWLVVVHNFLKGQKFSEHF